MRYRDVIHLEPIEDIIQLIEADDENVAREHVRTYVISTHMADNLLHVVIPQLQFARPTNNKGPQQGGAPQSYAELQPSFLKQLHPAKHEVLPELASLLEENFLLEPDGRWRLPDPRRAAYLEALRQKALLREFKGYQQGSGRLKQFRSEAVRAGFAEAYRQGDWPAILQVAGRLPESVL